MVFMSKVNGFSISTYLSQLIPLEIIKVAQLDPLNKNIRVYEQTYWVLISHTHNLLVQYVKIVTLVTTCQTFTGGFVYYVSDSLLRGAMCALMQLQMSFTVESKWKLTEGFCNVTPSLVSLITLFESLLLALCTYQSTQITCVHKCVQSTYFEVPQKSRHTVHKEIEGYHVPPQKTDIYSIFFLISDMIIFSNKHYCLHGFVEQNISHHTIQY
ncbi:hypothetical protein Bhyg_05892 [Pseudolycoriella hygida]|uniref:Uncharacterized protein n=1 Tax=Pseudolycoriella hygida TaxID=35572 RepID=A0A9Q0N1M2_9DIPT|nr:hypothetical protein Bhyg_05892 [Pseudolycoriella hygida]